MTTIGIEELDRLEKVAREATQGDWGMSGTRQDLGGVNGHTIYAGPKQEHIAHVCFDKRTGEGFSDAKFIGACSPATILRLIAALRAKAGA